jgi:hypothetical protein
MLARVSRVSVGTGIHGIRAHTACACACASLRRASVTTLTTHSPAHAAHAGHATRVGNGSDRPGQWRRRRPFVHTS